MEIILLVVLIAVIILLRRSIRKSEAASRAEGDELMERIRASVDKRSDWMRDLSRRDLIRTAEILGQDGIRNQELEELASLIYEPGMAEEVQTFLKPSEGTDPLELRFVTMTLVYDAERLFDSEAGNGAGNSTYPSLSPQVKRDLAEVIERGRRGKITTFEVSVSAEAILDRSVSSGSSALF